MSGVFPCSLCLPAQATDNAVLQAQAHLPTQLPPATTPDVALPGDALDHIARAGVFFCGQRGDCLPVLLAVTASACFTSAAASSLAASQTERQSLLRRHYIGEEFNAFAQRVGASEFEARVKDLTMPIEFSLENMNYFIDWTKDAPFEVIRGEGECAV